MDKITLIASDFDHLDVPIYIPTPKGWRRNDWNLDNNGNSTSDCPIARSLKRAGIPDPDVNSDRISGTGLDIYNTGNFSMYEVDRCRLELLAGAEEAYIQIIG